MAFFRGDFTVGNAFLWLDTTLAPNAGTDVGSTPFKVRATDAAGKVADGFIGAVGAGEAWADIIGGTDPTLLNGDFAAGDPPTGWIKETCTSARETGAGNYNVSPSCKVTVTAGQPYGDICRLVSIASGKLVKYSVYLKSGNNVNAIRSLIDPVSGSGHIVLMTENPTSITQYVAYGTQLLASSQAWAYALRIQEDGKYAYVDDVVVQTVTDPPSTGVHVVSAYGGSVRAWTSIDSGFNPNTIVSAVVSHTAMAMISAYYNRKRRS